MLTLDRVKELLNEPSMSDQQAEEIRDKLRVFAEIIFDQWQSERARAKSIAY